MWKEDKSHLKRGHDYRGRGMTYTMRPDGQRSCRFRVAAGAGSCKPASASCASQGRRAGKLPKRAGPQAPPPAAPRCRCRLRRQTPPPPLLPPLQHWRPVHPPPGVQSWPAAARAWGPVSVSRSCKCGWTGEASNTLVGFRPPAAWCASGASGNVYSQHPTGTIRSEWSKLCTWYI